MDDQRGLVQRLERRLEDAVGDAFARMFGGAVVPGELAAALRREAAAGIRSLAGNRLLAPNDYVITLGVHDYTNVAADPDLTTGIFASDLSGYIGEQGWQTYGDVVVRFRQSPNLHTGQVRVHGAVNPDVSLRTTVGEPGPPQPDHASSAEPGVSPMTDNPTYRGGPGQGRRDPEHPEYYDEGYGRHHDDSRAGQEPDGPYPPTPGSYPPEQGGYPDQPAGGFPPPRRPDQGGGYPEQEGYRGQPGQHPAGYPPSYEQRPPGGYGGQPEPPGPHGWDQGRQQAPGGYVPPAPGEPGYSDYGAGYGRPPARHDDYAQPEQRPPYPDQVGPPYREQEDSYYGRQDYGQPDYGRYAEPPPAGSYGEGSGGRDFGQGPGQDYAQDYGQEYSPPPARAAYGAPAQGGYDYGPSAPGGYDYGQPPAAPGGYAGYGQQGYSAPATVTLQLDDGSGRTYQLSRGSNVVGRGQDAQFRLPDTGVSRRHLEIRWDGQVALLSDLNSTNGTTVNNAPVQEWQLADGDVIRVGHSEIVVHIH
ncbi:MAG TPA: FhaA domain-containing protein [Mycobacterium sp.]